MHHVLSYTYIYIYIYIESHHQAGKAPKENSYISHVIFPYIMQAYHWDLNFTVIIKIYDKMKPLYLKSYYIHTNQ